jgi:hypothetical protein
MKVLRHLLHPKVALWPKNPQTFLVAGMSHATQEIATLTVTATLFGDFTTRPFSHPIRSSSTRGDKYELIDKLGSLGPGMIPTKIKFSSLYL